MKDESQKTEPRRRSGKAIPPRWEDAPSILEVEEAAAILRWSSNTLYERIAEDRRSLAAGGNPANPVPVLRRGRRITIPADLLREWTHREVKASSDSGAS